MKRLIWIIIIIALAAGGYYAYTQYQARQAQAALENIITQPVRRGPLTATVGATGTVRANQTAVLSWQTSGTVDTVSVEIGDTVSAGDVLASLRESSLQQNVILARNEILNAQKSIENLQEPPTELMLAQARQAITDAEKALDTAERRVRSLQLSASQADIDQARANLTLAQNNLDKARDAFEPYENKPETDLVRANFLSRLAQAQKEYDAALRLLNNLLGTANPLDVAVALANLEVAQAALLDAQERYEDLQAGPDERDIQMLETRITAAQTVLDQVQITAPFDATITDVQVKPGDQAAPGKITFQIDDLSRLLVDVQVSEIDINRIQPGQNVILTFDAILAKEYSGRVIQVAPVGDLLQGVVSFKVTVELLDADQDVRPGMTAAVNIVVSELEDVLLVPNRAVRILDGQRVVYILKNGSPEPVAIVLGASSDVDSQILEGELQEGDLIVLNPPSVFQQQGPPAFVQ